MRRHSPYNYAFDNPIYFIDADGMAPKGFGGIVQFSKTPEPDDFDIKQADNRIIAGNLSQGSSGPGDPPKIFNSKTETAVGEDVANQLDEVVVNGKSRGASGQGGEFLDKGLDYAGKTNDVADAFSKTLGTNGLTAVMVNGGKTIGRYSVPAGIVINTGQVFNGVRKDGYIYGYNAQKATAGAVGGIAGASAGFEVGFTVGLAFEGVGAIPGAVIGSIVGGFGGAWGGAYGGSKLGESLISNKAQ